MNSVSNGNSEVWRPITRYDGKYEVSNFGEVRNASTKRVLKRVINNRGGYWQVYVWIDGKTCGRNVHRLVAEEFIPNPDNLPCVNHKDGDYLNPREDNLEWCTHQHNTAHAIADLGRTFVSKLQTGKGEASGAHKLTEVEVRSIKRLLAKGLRQSEIAARFDTCATNISSIKRGLTWSHV